MKSGKLFIIAVLWPISLCAQIQYPKDYFLFPIKPGQQNFLAGNMGELRSNHFHGGLDIKTDMRTGLNVYAAADGYVSRIKASTFGYGNTVYITHPNGLVTVYAHLEKFNKEIGDAIREYQYRNKTFESDYYPDPGLLPVKKGDIIALSGNTGGSAGPHLHFEIRDEKENLLNPLLFGFKEIQDNSAPVFTKLAVQTFEINSRVNHAFGKMEFNPVKSGTTYSLPSFNAWGTIGLQLKAYDKMNGTANTYGISTVEVIVDGSRLFYQNLETFAFDENRYINVHMDYEDFIENQSKYQKCYIADGNKLNIYQRDLGDGKLRIAEERPYKIEVTIGDALGNKSQLAFTIHGKKPAKGNITGQSGAPGYDIFENILKIKGKAGSGSSAKIFKTGNSSVLEPDYIKGGDAIYLYDLRKGLPDSIQVSNKTFNFHFHGMIAPGQDKVVESGNIKVKIPSTALFDTLYLQLHADTAVEGKETFLVGDYTIPLFSPVNVEYSVVHPDPIHKEHAYVYIKHRHKGQQYEKGTWEGEKISFGTKNFGKFVIVEDTIKPTIKLLSISGNTIKFNIFDKNSGIQSFNAWINDEWLLMNYEHKNNLIWSERYDKTVPLKGKFKLEVTDKAGNISIFTTTIP